MGPTSNPKKTRGAHRADMIHKLQPRIDIYARKLREMYHREGTVPSVHTNLNPIREREPTDTLEMCIKEKVIPGKIAARDEFADWDMIWPWRTPFNVTKSEHGFIRPWYVTHPVTEEEIRVTVNNIDYHAKTKLPYWIDF